VKACPSCRRTYPDNAPNFCPQDGTQLVGNFPAFEPTPPATNVTAPHMSNAPPYSQPFSAQPSAPTSSMPVRLPSNPICLHSFTLFALSALFASIVELLRRLSRLLKEPPSACRQVSLSDLRCPALRLCFLTAIIRAYHWTLHLARM
jgi:hypothetical protein